MREAAEAVVRESLGVQAGERMPVVADTRTRAIGEALREAAARAGAEGLPALNEAGDPGTDLAELGVGASETAALTVIVEPTLRIGATPIVEGGRFLL